MSEPKARLIRDLARSTARFTGGLLVINAVMFGPGSFLVLSAASGMVAGGDWPRFRGPNGSGISADIAPMPVRWSPTKNVKWKARMPGPGSSSPIVVGDKVFVTCWSGYGLERGRPGDKKRLKRHLLCFDRQTGNTIWEKTVDAFQPEEDYSGMFAEHGYATHTPVSDGERVYVFFGKSGALAFDLTGNQIWQTAVGTESDRMGWGSACSPIVYKNLVIVTASAESQSMYGLDRENGKQVWRAEAEGFRSTWGTPVLAEVDANRTDLVLGVPYKIWGFNPDTGKIRWYCEAFNDPAFCSSVVSVGKVVYATGDVGNSSIAINAGGENDVTKSHVVWTGGDRNRISSPVVAGGKLYLVNNRVATCVDAKTGSRKYQGRLAGSSTPAAQNDGGRRGSGPGAMGGNDYSSPVVADGKLYFVARNGDAYVLKLGDKFEQLATNRVTEDTEDFSASPAISDGALFIRSSRHLYCIAEGAKAN
jgi:hypothetical protein